MYVCMYVYVHMYARTYLDKTQECLHFLNVQDAVQSWCATPLNHRLPEHFGKTRKGEQM